LEFAPRSGRAGCNLGMMLFLPERPSPALFWTTLRRPVAVPNLSIPTVGANFLANDFHPTPEAAGMHGTLCCAGWTIIACYYRYNFCRLLLSGSERAHVMLAFGGIGPREKGARDIRGGGSYPHCGVQTLPLLFLFVERRYNFAEYGQTDNVSTYMFWRSHH
jgi:hypothetical protein